MKKLAWEGHIGSLDHSAPIIIIIIIGPIGMMLALSLDALGVRSGTNPGRQDCPGCRREGIERHLRGRLPWVFLRLPAGTEPAHGAGCPAYGDHEPARDLVLDADIRSFFDSVELRCMRTRRG
jgi:hypothetical protein